MKSEDKHKTQIRKEVEIRGLTSVMNNTKWRELCNAMYKELPFPPAYNRKDILDTGHEPFTENAWYHGDYEEGILPFYSIEWIEVRAKLAVSQGRLVKDKINNIEDLFLGILKKYSIPYKYHNGSFFIYGYTNNFSEINK